jgi:hypothetical protein
MKWISQSCQGRHAHDSWCEAPDFVFALYCPENDFRIGACFALQAFSLKLERQQSVFSSTTQWGSFSIWSIL